MSISDFTSCRSEHLGGKIRVLPQVSSTNDLLKAEAEEGIVEAGEILIAEHQTAGRGRLERSWESPPGKSLLFSILFRPKITEHSLQLMGLMVSLGIMDGLTQYFEVNEKQSPIYKQVLRLKWPNDIMVGRRKLCGILSDAGLDRNNKGFVVVGIGINVNQTTADFPEELRSIATSLCIMTGGEHDRVHLFKSLIRNIDRYYARSMTESSHWIAQTWLNRAGIAGTIVECRNNGETIRGKCNSICADGALELKLQDGSIRVIYSGDFQ